MGARLGRLPSFKGWRSGQGHPRRGCRCPERALPENGSPGSAGKRRGGRGPGVRRGGRQSPPGLGASVLRASPGGLPCLTTPQRHLRPSLPSGPCWEVSDPGDAGAQQRPPGSPCPPWGAVTGLLRPRPQTYKLGAEQLLPRLRGAVRQRPLTPQTIPMSGRGQLKLAGSRWFVPQDAGQGRAKAAAGWGAGAGCRGSRPLPAFGDQSECGCVPSHRKRRTPPRLITDGAERQPSHS